jgi:hypothetical protein
MILYNPTVSGSLLVTGSLTTTGTITSQTLVVQTITSSIEFNTGSTRNGTLSTNTHEFTGSVGITGSAAALLSVNNNVLYVSSSGNVGIGTTTPNEKLHVSGNISVVTSGGTRIGFNTTDQFSALGTSVPQYGMAYGWSTQPLGLSGYYGIAFFSEGNERMRITSGGNIGLGTGAPLYKTHIVSSGSNAFLGISNQGVSNGDRQIRIGFGGGGSDTFAQIQGTRYNIADDVFIAIQSGGGQVGIAATSIRSSLGGSTRLSVSGAAIGAASSGNSSAIDLGISIDQGDGGLTILFLASRNTSDGTSTASAVYIISFYYNGGNFPSIAYLGGTNNFVTFGSSGGKLTAANGSGGNAAYSWFTSR